MYDVIIAGAGPAGASAAYFLGQAGRKVLVLEKEKLPRYKACGGGVSLRFLQSQFPFAFEGVIEDRVCSMSYTYNNHTVTIPCKNGGLVMVMREHLDAYILSQAGVEVKENSAIRKVVEREDCVSVETAQGEVFEGLYLIGADGANSVAAHAVGREKGRDAFPAIEAEVKASPEVLARFAGNPTFIFKQIHWGYLWVFPKSDHLSVGVAAVNPGRGVLQATLERVMNSYGISLENVPLRGHLVPYSPFNARISTRRILLAGDAAGLVDPLSGEGIRPAILSGRLAAEAILAGHPESYSKKVKQKIGFEHALSLFAAKIFYRLPGVCLRLGAPNPFTTRAIMNVMAGGSGGFTVMLLAILSLPVYLLVEGAARLAGLLGGPPRREKFRQAVYQGS
ncbi:MAG: geranylgeranyl reductase family protein [Anaerolineaceae bacterium]|nr:geranylgeranyl reductase family protein [Anaerolineaceae bacterium]